jgi:hypothetical protein
MKATKHIFLSKLYHQVLILYSKPSIILINDTKDSPPPQKKNLENK